MSKNYPDKKPQIVLSLPLLFIFLEGKGPNIIFIFPGTLGNQKIELDFLQAENIEIFTRKE